MTDKQIEARIDMVALYYRIDPAQLTNKCRKARICEARWIGFYLFRLEGLSYPAIGRIFHRHHATVIHAMKKFASRRKYNARLNDTLFAFEKRLHSLRALEKLKEEL